MSAALERLCLELCCMSRTKHTETICGDCWQTFGSRERRIVTVSDGLGSGVRANILATLTATILGTLLDRRIPLEECIETVASTLPVSKDQGLAYATFTAAEVEGDTVYLVNYDNPSVMLFRDGKPYRTPYTVRFVGDKEIHECRVPVQEGDFIILMTDGVTHSGIGKHSAHGWAPREIADYLMEKNLSERDAAEVCALLQHRCLELCNGENDDDTTVAVLHFRTRENLNIMMGPPADKKDDERVLKMFFRNSGCHVVCGGSTSRMVSRYLDQPINVLMGTGDAEVPDMAVMEGVEMVTEGVITLERVCALCQSVLEDPSRVLDIEERVDPASLLTRMLMKEATDVNIFFGIAANDAHDDIGIGFETKISLIRRLEELLNQAGKTVKINYN